MNTGSKSFIILCFLIILFHILITTLNSNRDDLVVTPTRNNPNIPEIPFTDKS